MSGSRWNQYRPVKVVKVTTGVENQASKFVLDYEALIDILHKDSVKDLPVVVLSIAGKLREGKSFLLNFIIRYLKNEGRPDWMGGDEDVPLEGFEWKAGPDSCTKGVNMWPEVFVVDCPNKRKVAVVVMDIQGIFDTKGTIEECTTMFALSTLLSSIQIYNVMRAVERDNLEALEFFTEYGKAAQVEGTSHTPFKHLEFLVRDWPWSETHPYGAEGGKNYIEKELAEQKGIRSSFEQISCFLLPYPGDLVARDNKKKQGEKFNGKLSDIDDDFKLHLNDFLSKILAPNNLEMAIKKLNGKIVTTREIVYFFQSYIRMFEQGTLPTPQTAFQATAELVHIKALETAMKAFSTAIRNATNDLNDPNTVDMHPLVLAKKLETIRKSIVIEFECKLKYGGNQTNTKFYLDEFDKLISPQIEELLLLCKQKRDKKIADEEWKDQLKAIGVAGAAAAAGVLAVASFIFRR